MRIAKKIKRSTIVVVSSVLFLTFATMRVTYSAVFEVKSQMTVQQISSGTLSVIIDDELSSRIGLSELMPTPTSELPTGENSVITTNNYSTITLKNNGTLDSAFSLAVEYDSLPQGKTENDQVPLNYLIIGLYDVSESKWLPFGNTYYKQIGSIVPNNEGAYPILRNSINAPTGNDTYTTKQYRIYIWLKEDTPITEIGKIAYLKISVKSTTINDGVNTIES